MKVQQIYQEVAERGEDTLPSIHPNPQGRYKHLGKPKKENIFCISDQADQN